MTRIANFLAKACLWLGMILPLFTLGFEGITHACSSTFFDPIPTWWHYLAILPVPLACFFTWRMWRDPTEAAIGRLGVINRAAWPVAILYFVSFARISLMACVALPFSLLTMVGTRGLIFLLVLASLGPLLGFAGLCVSTGSLSRLRATLPDPVADAHRRRGRYGWLAGLVLLMLAEAPPLWTEFWLQRAVDKQPSTQAMSLQMLRSTGSEALLLRQCYDVDRGALYGPSLALLYGREGVPFSLSRFFWPVGFNKAREIYFKVTGLPFNEVRPPRMNRFMLMGMNSGLQREDALDGVEWDGERGGDAVGARIRGLSLATSGMEWNLDSPSALAYGEWTLEFHNAQSVDQEARCQILLPPGGFVSRLNLWIDGKPQEAAFGARAQVKAAYRQVAVVERRDPVLVNMSGPDRVAVQCFPVPPAGQMKIRIGITAPLTEVQGNTSGLALPVFLERNFAVAPGFKHTVSRRNDAGAVETRSMEEGTLGAPRLLSSKAAAPVVWAEDPFALPVNPGGEAQAFLTRRRVSVRQAPARRVVVVLDGSFRLRECVAALQEALAAIPSNLKLEVVLATDREPLVFSRDAVGGQVVARAFVGGRDNTPALLQGLKLALEPPRGRGLEPATLIWLHGPQPWAFDRKDLLPPSRDDASRAVALQSSETYPGALAEYLAGLPAPPTLHAVELVPGPNRLLEQLFQTTDLRNGTRWDGTPAGLKSIVASIVGEGERWQSEYVRASTVPQEGVKVWDQLARQQVYEEVLGAYQGANLIPGDLARTAARYQLVTPYSGAVVLETRQQYASAGLEPVDPDSSPKIPNGVPEPSRALLLVFAFTWALSRRRRRHRMAA